MASPIASQWNPHVDVDHIRDHTWCTPSTNGCTKKYQGLSSRPQMSGSPSWIRTHLFIGEVASLSHIITCELSVTKGLRIVTHGLKYHKPRVNCHPPVLCIMTTKIWHHKIASERRCSSQVSSSRRTAGELAILCDYTMSVTTRLVCSH